jgi:uncharacterized membrane protein
MAAATATRKRKSASGDGASSAPRRRATPPNSDGHGGTPRSPVAKAKKAAATNAPKSTATKATKKAAKTTAKKALVPSGPGGQLARRLAMMALKKAANRIVQSGAAGLRSVTLRVVDESRDVVQRAMTPGVPVQCSIDVAVPVRVAWDEWLRLDSLPEGAHRVHRIERDGDELYGEIDGTGQPEWRAEVIDEREDDSFAWRSVEGADCAGLITFHRLSDKLTRLELDLDALPTSPAEAVALKSPLARRRTLMELRRFKAHVEFLNPDVYAQDEESEDSE